MGYRVSDIAQRFDLEIDGDPDIVIEGLCGVSDNLPRHLSFVAGARYLADAVGSNIPAFVTTRELRVSGKTNLFHDHPDYAISLVGWLFLPTQITQAEWIHLSAVVDPTTTLAGDVFLGAHVVVGANTRIGSRTRIMPGCVIGDRVDIGEDCVVHSNCVVREDTLIGDRVVLQPGVVVGADGYGYVYFDGRHNKIPQLGRVVIESDVEIGANSAIDRGRFTETRIGRGTKIDDCVMLAHNVRIGEDCLLVAQTGISGSTRLGDRVTTAGQVGMVGHLTIADDVTVLGQSMVTKSIREPGLWAGSPARPAKIWRKAMARFYAGFSKE